MQPKSIHQTFTAALDALVAEIKQDRSILAAILCGSLSHDTVWAKSDIDLVLVTIDDRKVESAGRLALRRRRERPRLADAARGVPQDRRRLGHTTRSCIRFWPRAACSTRTTDASPISAPGCTRSASATRSSSCCAPATSALPPIYKAHKWFVTRGDLDYTALWILYAATPLARIEVIGRRLLADREVLPQALTLNPGVLQDGLHRPAQHQEDEEERRRRRSMRSTRTSPNARRRCSRRSLEYLREAGETRSCSEIETHFKRNFDIDGVDDGLRIPRATRADRQGRDLRAPDEAQQRRRAGTGVLPHRASPCAR